MPANVDAMFSVREMPWHREGVVLDDYPQSWDEARKLAGLDWEPVEAAAYRQQVSDDDLRERFASILAAVTAGNMTHVGAVTQMMIEQGNAYPPDEGFKRIVRSDNGATLAVKQDSYTVIPHAAFGAILTAVTLQPNVRLETGGCLEGGKSVWMLARLDEPFQTPGDSSAIYPYVAITSRHDGTAATAARATMVRIVCANTFSMAEAEGERSGRVYRFVHRGDPILDVDGGISEAWRPRMAEARAVISGARDDAREYAKFAEELFGFKVNGAQKYRFIRAFIPSPPETVISERVRYNVDTARQQVCDLLDGPTIEGAGIGGTALGLVQAAGEWADHIRGNRTGWDGHLRRTILKDNPLKAKAVKLALEVAAG